MDRNSRIVCGVFGGALVVLLIIVSFRYRSALSTAASDIQRANVQLESMDGKVAERDKKIEDLTTEKVRLGENLAEAKKIGEDWAVEAKRLDDKLKEKISESAANAEAVNGLKARQRELNEAVEKLTVEKSSLGEELARRKEKERLEQETKDAEAKRQLNARLVRERGLAPLEAWAKDGDPRQRKILILCVAENRIKVGYPVLVRLLADNEIGNTAMNALSRNLDPKNLGIGKEAVVPILEAMKDPTIIPVSADASKMAEVKQRAMEAVVNIGDEAVDDLILALQGEKELREWARDCIRRIGVPAKPRLQKAMVGPNELIRIPAFEAYKWIEANEKAPLPATDAISAPATSVPPQPQVISVSVPAPVVNVTPIPAQTVNVTMPEPIVNFVAPAPRRVCR